ncbi:hypothetical protein [Providencia phage PSTCR6]|nr:hypothetical protein [Providencia phage PSTCR6]
MLNKIKDICYVNNKLVPKRNLKWLEKNDILLFNDITSKFPGVPLPQVIVLLENGILNSNMIPKCHCGNNVIVYRGKLLEACSNKCSIKSRATQNKTRQTCLNRYGKQRKWGNSKTYALGTHHTQVNLKNLDDLTNHDKMTKLSNSSWETVAEHFGLSLNSHSSAFKFMEKHGYPIKHLSGVSKMEKELVTFVKQYASINENDKSIIPPYELDIYIPEKKLAIEFNGLYWHSSGTCENDKEKSEYHLMKTEMCESNGIHLLHIFENEWADPIKKEIWKSVIRHKLGLSKKIYARKCELKTISSSEANIFCERNHLQGKCHGIKIALGLFYNNELVQIATFGKARYTKGYDYELLRLCSKLNYTVVGGASKLTKNKSFVSYANRRWSYGGVYDAMNLRLLKVSGPCYWYIKQGKLYHRSSFMKHKLKDKLETFDPDLTEVENCYANGLRRIWDSGNLVYGKL